MGAAADFHAKEFNQADVPNTEQTSPTHPRLPQEPPKKEFKLTLEHLRSASRARPAMIAQKRTQLLYKTAM